MRKLKVAVGMSGGVDSSLSAVLLKEQGCEVTGVFLDCWGEPGCGVNQGRKDALKVALKLRIPFKVLDLKKDYQEKVIDWFYRELRAGRTPNPDVMCNKEIKFGLFLDWAMKNNFDCIATGHYARRQIVYPALLKTDSSAVPATADYLHSRYVCSPMLHRGNQAKRTCESFFSKEVNFCLYQAVDKKKDQTYFLYGLTQKQLSKVMFPIGEMTKKDSVGICFIGNKISFNDFVKRKVKEHEGEVIDKKGKIIGSHKGVEFYTIGQRHGFTVKPRSRESEALYVLGKSIKSNRLIVGEKKEGERREFIIEELYLINPKRKLPREELTCRIRHQGRLINCKIDGKKVRLNQSEFGVAIGQICVVYCGEECLGGGVIKS